MASRDLITKLKATVALANGAAITAATNGVTIDTSGAMAHAFFISLNDVEAAESIVIKVQHGDFADASDMADAPSQDVLISGVTDNESGGVSTVTVTTAQGDGVYAIGYVGPLQYIRVVVTPTGGDGVLASALHLAGRLHIEVAA